MGKRPVFEDPDGAHERGTSSALARVQVALVRPSRKLAVRGELERQYLIT